MSMIRHSSIRGVLALSILLMVIVPTVSGETKSLDRRTSSTEDRSAYFIVFCARDGSATGHAFVAWGAEDERQKASVQTAYGFYPRDGKGLFGSVPGEIRNEAFVRTSGTLTHRLIVRVDRHQYLKTQALQSKWATRDYKLYSKNCVSFTADVARALGLKVPESTEGTFPSNFIAQLIRSN